MTENLFFGKKQKKTAGFFRISAVILALLVLLFSEAFSAFSVRADNDAYGEDAYKYMKIMNDCFGRRINNNEITTDKTTLYDAKTYLIEKMAEFGYTANLYEGTINAHDFTSMTFLKPGLSAKKLVIGAHYDCVDTNGCEDNGTGVGMVLELAKRFAGTDTPLTLEFCFWDGEEYRGYAGSFIYLSQIQDRDNILCYINLDSIGSGDNMYAYGGDYDENGVLLRSWGYNMAMTLSRELGIDLHEMPDGIDRYVPPTRTTNSDQYYFNEFGIPYIYFEANAWVNDAGVQMNSRYAFFYNSALDAFADTNGQIIHTKYDDLDVLESLVPGRIQSHLTDFSRIISELIRRMDENSPAIYAAYVPYKVPETEEEVGNNETSAAGNGSENETEGNDTSPAESENKEETEPSEDAENPENANDGESGENGDAENPGDTEIAENTTAAGEPLAEAIDGEEENSADISGAASGKEKLPAAAVWGWCVIGAAGIAFLFSLYKIITILRK